MASGRTLLATGNSGGGIRLWDPQTRQQVALLEGHTGVVRALCTLVVGGRQLLASAGDDRTARVWDPTSATSRLTIPLPYPPRCCVGIDNLLVIGLDAGMLALSVDL